jgi:hypothetical protein
MQARRFIVFTLGWIILVLGAEAQETVNRLSSGKKMVEYGWDTPTPSFIVDHLSEMEKRPFDGVLFHLECKGNVFEPHPLDEARLSKDLDAISRIQWGTFTDNFLMMYAASDQDWFNDSHWEAIEHNTRLVSRAARQAKCAGVCFDPEPYGANPWSYTSAPHKDERTFAEYEAIARKRGRQFIQAIELEFPDPRILTFFQMSLFLSLFEPATDQARKEDLAERTYALLPAFLEGMLEGAGSHVEIIDGNENAYYYTNALSYFDSYLGVTQRARRALTPEIWPAYAAKVKMGQALYIDQYYGLRQTTKTLGNVMSPDEQAKWMEHNAYWALYTTDRYVWCYSERMNWWTGTDLPPGAEQAIRNARAAIDAGDPLSFELGPIIEAAKAKDRENKR